MPTRRARPGPAARRGTGRVAPLRAAAATTSGSTSSQIAANLPFVLRTVVRHLGAGRRRQRRRRHRARADHRGHQLAVTVAPAARLIRPSAVAMLAITVVLAYRRGHARPAADAAVAAARGRARSTGARRALRTAARHGASSPRCCGRSARAVIGIAARRSSTCGGDGRGHRRRHRARRAQLGRRHLPAGRAGQPAGRHAGARGQPAAQRAGARRAVAAAARSGC